MLVFGEIGDPPRDPGRAVDKGERSWRHRPQPILDQRKMGAGEHDRVDPIAARLAE